MFPRLPTRFYCTKTKSKYSSTVLLPKTTFPLRLDNKKLLERDDKITNLVANDGLYTWQRSHLSEPEFVLHDGPPYANGSLHMGHAINKILKDIIVRFHILQGHKVHFVPGWDCHGLPIELKALDKDESDPLTIREKARNFAKTTIVDQMKNFKSWGVTGDWNSAYTTYSPKYMKTQLKLFNKLYQKGLIYRSEKPIYWSPSSQTALAEAELEYNEKHKSLSVFVRFQVQQFPNHENDRVYALVWTTTPWTLPSNQAICYNPSLKYSLVKNGQDANLYLIASELIPSLSNTLNTSFEIIETFSGEFLNTCTYTHPVFKNRQLKFLPGSFPSITKGTGLVHTAPAHGPDDFLLALQHKLPIDNLVDEHGCYNNLAGENLSGKFVLTQGTEKVVDLLGENIVHSHDYIHSYPYDWRTKKPVILRASKQWFVDTDSIKTRALELLEAVEIRPKANSNIYRKYLTSQLEKRAYWCISRQRKWGVPIPVFFTRNEEPLINEDSVRHFCDLIDIHGGDFWWKLKQEQLFPKNLQEAFATTDVKKGQDIMDIWFDSGISWANVLEGDKVADLYLEGVDQFTGWFQSSLITSVALREKTPYKKIYVHGFTVDEKGVKMSKSLGNVIDPQDVICGSNKAKPYGIDALRWWVGCHANQDSVAQVSPQVLQSCCEELQKIRGVLRFALSALDCKRIEYDSLSILDKYLLHILQEFHTQINAESYEFNFHRVGKHVINFLTNPVSALYYTAIKDRLYCDHAHSNARQAAQYVLNQIFEVVSVAIAPIVPHLVEEMYLHLPVKSGKGFFVTDHVIPVEEWRNCDVAKLVERVLEVKKELNKQAGAATLDLDVTIGFEDNIFGLIKKLTSVEAFEEELEDVLQVARVRLEKGNPGIVYKKTDRLMCPRCRRFSTKEDLCVRCKNVVDSDYLDVQKN